MAVHQTQRIEYVCDLCGKSTVKSYDIEPGKSFMPVPHPLEMGFVEVANGDNGAINLFCSKHVFLELGETIQ